MQWGPPSVTLLIPPHHSVHLLAWGRDPAGGWWGLVTWERHMARHFETPVRVDCTGWTAAANVQPVEHQDYGRVAQIALDKDPAWWPTPPGPRLGHFGVIEVGTSLEPPDDWRWVAPRVSRR